VTEMRPAHYTMLKQFLWCCHGWVPCQAYRVV